MTKVLGEHSVIIYRAGASVFEFIQNGDCPPVMKETVKSYLTDTEK
jgi:hypothetical protein